MEIRLAVLVFILLLPSAGANYMNYEILLLGENADLSLEMSLESETPVNVFNGALLLPGGAEVLGVSDSKGAIEDFSVHDGRLDFSTNYSVAKELEIVNISMKLRDVRNGEFAPLYNSRISMPAAVDSDVSVVIAGGGFISFEPNHGFSGELTVKKIELAGTGPASVKFFYSSEGTALEHYVLFNRSSLSDEELVAKGFSDAETYFGWIPKITGIEPPFEKFPVVVMDDAEFAEKVNAYSEGVYRTGGIILLKAGVFGENAAPVILHETVHGFNAQAMTWNNSGSAWFDEGMAKFTEYLARRRIGMRLANLFDGVNEYREGDYIIRVYPANSVEQLMEYYSGEKTFMNEWTPERESTREFGYSFGELFVRDYVYRNGFTSLLNAYRKFLDQEEEIDEGGKFTQTTLSLLGAEFEPCNYPSEQEVKDCLEQLNEFEPDIPDTKSIIKLGLEESEKEIEGLEKVEEMEREKWSDKVEEFKAKSEEMTESVYSSILSLINSFLSKAK